jgi:Ca2+/Na+ antiporter
MVTFFCARVFNFSLVWTLDSRISFLIFDVCLFLLIFTRFFVVTPSSKKKTTDETNRSHGDEIESAASILNLYDKIITQLLFNTYLVTIYKMLEVESIWIS